MDSGCAHRIELAIADRLPSTGADIDINALWHPPRALITNLQAEPPLPIIQVCVDCWVAGMEPSRPATVGGMTLRLARRPPPSATSFAATSASRWCRPTSVTSPVQRSSRSDRYLTRLGEHGIVAYKSFLQNQQSSRSCIWRQIQPSQLVLPSSAISDHLVYSLTIYEERGNESLAFDRRLWEGSVRPCSAMMLAFISPATAMRYSPIRHRKAP